MLCPPKKWLIPLLSTLLAQVVCCSFSNSCFFQFCHENVKWSSVSIKCLKKTYKSSCIFFLLRSYAVSVNTVKNCETFVKIVKKIAVAKALQKKQQTKEYKHFSLLHGKARQVYLYSTFHTHW